MAEGETHIPFAIARTYWTYDVPGGESRGGHAHKKCQEFIIAASGSFSVTLDNGEQKKTYHLNHPWEGLISQICKTSCLKSSNIPPNIASNGMSMWQKPETLRFSFTATIWITIPTGSRTIP